MFGLGRALVLYIFLLLAFRFSGKRTLQDLTIFDLVMLLIISEATQAAILDEDYSLINSILVITLYLLVNIGLSLLKDRNKKADKYLEGTAIILLMDGQPYKQRMHKSRVGEEDILERARELHGLERLDQIKYAILETDGKINIISSDNAGK